MFIGEGMVAIVSRLHSVFKSLIRLRCKWDHDRFVRAYDFPSEGTFLDVSCGNGTCFDIVREHFPDLRFYGVDISDRAIREAQTAYPWAHTCVADARSLPFPEGNFDVVLSCMSLHYYKKPQEVFNEIARALKPGGRLYISDVIPHNTVIQTLFNFDGCPESYHFERYYTREEVDTLASLSGLEPVSSRSLGWLSSARLLVYKKPESTTPRSYTAQKEQMR